MPAQQQKNQESPGRIYRVTRGTVGPWSQGSVFTEADFRYLHPLPKNPEEAGLDAETYHGDLIGRLVLLGVVVHDPDAKPTGIPIGPEGRPPQGVRNPSIAAAVSDALNQRQAMAAAAPATPTPAQAPGVAAPVEQPATPKK